MDTATRQPVMVTGASGFIGRRLVRRLIELQFRVFCLVRASSRISDLGSAGVKLLKGDVTNQGSVERALSVSQAGTVFHLAGLLRAQRWGTMADDFASVNSGGVKNVAESCAERASPPVLVVVSSLAAAGPCSRLSGLRVEGDLPVPVSNYGRSKLAGEQSAAEYARAVPITLVRPPIVFGPGDQAVLEIFRPIARLGVHIVPGWGRGDRRLSLIYVDDLVEGLLLAAEKGERLRGHASAAPGEGVYYMSGEDHPTYVQFGQAISKALGQRPPAVVGVPDPLLKSL